MTKPCYLGIDTSNYTTSVALANEQGEIIANLKAPLPVKAGECGLRQSDAVFAHVKNLPSLMQELGALLASEGYRPAAVGVSATPRDASGSYMPCFLSGLAAAESFCAALGIPLYRFSHQNGHISAAHYSSGMPALAAGQRFGAFHVSGGTTDMLLVDVGERDFTVSEIGGSADLHAGQAVDRIGVALGLDFPCGPALETLACQNEKKIPRPRICVRENTCNLSGLENLALKLWRESGDKALTAAYVLRFLSQTLIALAEQLREAQGGIPILFAGGVMSNKLIAADIRARLDKVYFAAPAFSADNAAGVALLCRRNHLSLK